MGKGKSIDISITGKVQGVWFRKYTQKKALELGLKGFVENLKDGRVHLIATGNDKEIEQFRKWCSIGSPLSKVEKIQSKELETIHEFHTFTIKK